MEQAQANPPSIASVRGGRPQPTPSYQRVTLYRSEPLSKPKAPKTPPNFGPISVAVSLFCASARFRPGIHVGALYTVGICHRAKTLTGVPVRPSRPDIDLHAGAVH